MSNASNVFVDILDTIMGRQPKEVEGLGNLSSKYHMRKCKRVILGRFEISHLPKWWDKNFFLETLFLGGKICITNYQGLGVTPFKCSEFGINIFGKPNTVEITNEYLNTSFTRAIGVNCALVKIAPDYRGLMDMCKRTSMLMANADAGISTNLLNTRVAFLFPVSNKKEGKEVGAIYDQVTRGAPFVTYGKDIPVQPYTFPVKANYVASDILMDKRSIWNEFLTDLGINNANTDKRERLNAEEVNSNNEEIHANIQNILDSVQEGLDRANLLYDMDMHIRARTWKEMVEGGILDDREYIDGPANMES